MLDRGDGLGDAHGMSIAAARCAAVAAVLTLSGAAAASSRVPTRPRRELHIHVDDSEGACLARHAPPAPTPEGRCDAPELEQVLKSPASGTTGFIAVIAVAHPGRVPWALSVTSLGGEYRVPSGEAGFESVVEGVQQTLARLSPASRVRGVSTAGRYDELDVHGTRAIRFFAELGADTAMTSYVLFGGRATVNLGVVSAPDDHADAQAFVDRVLATTTLPAEPVMNRRRPSRPLRTRRAPTQRGTRSA